MQFRPEDREKSISGLGYSVQVKEGKIEARDRRRQDSIEWMNYC